jgi:hypothetical protein
MKLIPPILAAFLLAGCGNAPADDVKQDVPGVGANGRRDLAGTDARLNGKKAGISYGDYDVLRDHRGTGLAFASYGCMSDCADVMKGYRRAGQAKLSGAEQCDGETWGEVEGCVAFTQGFPSEIGTLAPLKN